MERRFDRGRQSDAGTRTLQRVPRSQAAYVFGPNLPPALAAGRGETILFETHDCYTGRVTADPHTYSWADAERRNPVTGPVFVEGAEVGDVLCVQIQQIRTAASGVAVIRPRAGILGAEVRRAVARVIPIADGRAEIAEGISVPVRPVIGVIGVASRHGEISTRYPGRHGGNMDTQEITVGSRLYLPVQVKGALLALGDVKACMGDGETSGTGVEVAAEVVVRLDTLPGGRFSWPRVETNDACITITSASSVKQAARLAVMEMVRWLEQDRGVDFETAYSLVGLGGDLRISQWVNPLVTARVVLPRAIMNVSQARPGRRSRIVRPNEEPGPVGTAPAVLIETAPESTMPSHPEPAPEAEQSELPSPPESVSVLAPKPEEPRRKRRWRRKRRSAQNRSSAPVQPGEESVSPGAPLSQAEGEPLTPPPMVPATADAGAPAADDVKPQPPARRKRRWRWRRRSSRPPPGLAPTTEPPLPPSPDNAGGH